MKQIGKKAIALALGILILGSCSKPYDSSMNAKRITNGEKVRSGVILYVDPTMYTGYSYPVNDALFVVNFSKDKNSDTINIGQISAEKIVDEFGAKFEKITKIDKQEDFEALKDRAYYSHIVSVRIGDVKMQQPLVMEPNYTVTYIADVYDMNAKILFSKVVTVNSEDIQNPDGISYLRNIPIANRIQHDSTNQIRRVIDVGVYGLVDETISGIKYSIQPQMPFVVDRLEKLVR